ncbi:carboxymuconolactone decarboxylase family protein [Streptomyces sp. KL116D]|uniref:carboxymuconolactone decarboxylase family protein n=1 Tax=Streptomyces sp. KL116D TaxID=3045152 RepID=UPI0035593512
MVAFGAAARKGLGDPVLAELVMIRASQINECAFCLDMHVDVAVEKNGRARSGSRCSMPGARPGVVHSERERAALALTDAGGPC